MPKYVVKARKPEIPMMPTAGTEIDRIIEEFKQNVQRTQYGAVGLVFHIHQGQVTRIERTVSISGKFELHLKGEDNGS